ncbi:hypothetical protein [Persephonella sp.]
MGVPRSILFGKPFDETVYEILHEMLGEERYKEFEDFLSFYKIEGTLKDDNKLVISIYFKHDRKWHNIAVVDLNTKRTDKLMTDRELYSKLNDENLFILQNLENEIKRTSTIILSIIAFLIGASIGIVILQIYN